MIAFYDEIPILREQEKQINQYEFLIILKLYVYNLSIQHDRDKQLLKIEKLKSKSSYYNYYANSIDLTNKNSNTSQNKNVIDIQVSLENAIENINLIPESDMIQADKIKLIELLEKMIEEKNPSEKEIKAKEVIKYAMEKGFKALKYIMPIVL
jgi:hypothetical protein